MQLIVEPYDFDDVIMSFATERINNIKLYFFSLSKINLNIIISFFRLFSIIIITEIGEGIKGTRISFNSLILEFC